MKFKIALYGSFNDSAGYVWRLPNGYRKEQFESIVRNFSKKYDDGRVLGENDLYGGYYIDVSNNLFFAFRFIDGHQDALGRAGVVITNWAVIKYSDVIGKNIKPLFDHLTLTRMPISESLDLLLQNWLGFNGSDSASFFQKERMLYGEDAKNIFHLPSLKCHRNILIQFVLKENQKEASLKFLSVPADNIKKTRPLPETKPISDQLHSVFDQLILKNIKIYAVFLGIFSIGMLVFLGVKYFPHKKTDIKPLAPTQPELDDPVSPLGNGKNIPKSAGPSITAKKIPPQPPSKKSTSVLTGSFAKQGTLSPEIKIYNGSWVILTPDHFWKNETLNIKRIIANKENKYVWGSFCVNQSRLIITFSKYVSLKKDERGYTVMDHDKKIGKFVIYPNKFNIVFRSHSLIDEELCGDFYLYDHTGQKKCAKLSIQQGSISFKVF